VAEFEGVCSGDIYVLEPKNERMLPDLLPFICQTDTFYAHAVNTSAGSLSPRTNWKQLAQYEFALPPLAEQRRIAEALQSSLSVAEAHYLAAQKALICVEATREHLFAKERTKSFSLGSVLEDIEAGRSLVGINEPPASGEYAVLKVSAVGANGFLPTESKTLVKQDEFIPQYSIKSGDLLVTRANTPDLVGMTCYVEQDYPNLMLCDKTLRLVPRDGIAPKLLWEALWTRSIRQQIMSMASGTGAAMKNISQAKLRKLQIQLPLNTNDDSPTLKRMSQVREVVSLLQKRLRNAQMLHQVLENDLLIGVQR
jgi:type I restriction enzyme S subunit